MSDGLLTVLNTEPHVTLVTAQSFSPRLSNDYRIDMDQFARMSGGFRFLQGALPFMTTT